MRVHNRDGIYCKDRFIGSVEIRNRIGVLWEKYTWFPPHAICNEKDRIMRDIKALEDLLFNKTGSILI